MGLLVLVSALLVLQGESDFVVSPGFGAIVSPSCLRIDGVSSSQILKVQPPAPDLDIGPYCYLNSTTNSMLTGVYASSGFIVTNSQCTATCSLPGCTMYRLTGTNSGVYARLNQCLVAEFFHYSVSGSMNETWCPWYDWLGSVFTFKGRTYQDQWYWLGWPTRDDCMNAILCGPSSHWFDPSRSIAKDWCQPTPVGKYSRQCSNIALPCSTPIGPLSFWTSHGFGSPSGCSYRTVAPALLLGLSTDAITAIVPFHVQFTLTLPQPVSGATAILLGVYSKIFYVGLRYLDFSNLVLITLLYGQLHTSPPISWYPGESRVVAISSVGSSSVQYFLNGALVFGINVVSASPTTLPATSQIPANLTSGIHIGPMFVDRNDPGGILYENVTEINFTICNVEIATGFITTSTSTTTASTTSTTSTTTSTSSTASTTTSTSSTVSTTTSAPHTTSAVSTVSVASNTASTTSAGSVASTTASTASALSTTTSTASISSRFGTSVPILNNQSTSLPTQTSSFISTEATASSPSTNTQLLTTDALILSTIPPDSVLTSSLPTVYTITVSSPSSSTQSSVSTTAAYTAAYTSAYTDIPSPRLNTITSVSVNTHSVSSGPLSMSTVLAIAGTVSVVFCVCVCVWRRRRRFRKRKLSTDFGECGLSQLPSVNNSASCIYNLESAAVLNNNESYIVGDNIWFSSMATETQQSPPADWFSTFPEFTDPVNSSLQPTVLYDQDKFLG